MNTATPADCPCDSAPLREKIRRWIPRGEAYIKRAGSTDNPVPADLKTHGGYGVRCASGILFGPWAYYEHAQAECAKHPGGMVVRFRTFLTKADSTTEARRARR